MQVGYDQAREILREAAAKKEAEALERTAKALGKKEKIDPGKVEKKATKKGDIVNKSE